MFSWAEPELSNDDEVSCLRTQHLAPGEIRTRDLAIIKSGTLPTELPVLPLRSTGSGWDIERNIISFASSKYLILFSRKISVSQNRQSDINCQKIIFIIKLYL